MSIKIKTLLGADKLELIPLTLIEKEEDK